MIKMEFGRLNKNHLSTLALRLGNNNKGRGEYQAILELVAEELEPVSTSVVSIKSCYFP